MTTACALPAVDALAARLLEKFRPGLLRLAARAGWQAGDLPGVAWLAAHDALRNYDSGKGNLDSRGWWCCRRQARGFLPPAGGLDDLDNVIGGDDPAAILDAAQQVGRLVELAAAAERRAEGKSARTARRWQERARGAAALLLRGDGQQGELF